VTVSDNTLLGGNGDDTLTIDVEAAGGTGGTGGNSGDAGFNGSSDSEFVVDGQAGVDVFHEGTAGAIGADGADGDTIVVSIVNNTMSGGTGDDELRLEVSAPPTATFDISGNTFDGGANTDVFDLSQLVIGSGVTVDLAAENVIIAGGFNTLLNIEELIATDYSDMIVGSTANEIFTGGAGADTYVFNFGSGLDTINGFEVGSDVIDLSAFGFADFAALSAFISNDGTDTFIDLDGTPATDDQVTVAGVTGLIASDFDLV